MTDRHDRLYKLQSYVERIDKIESIIKKAESQTFLSGFDFSILMQELLVSPTGYVMDTGDWENANREVALILIERIKKHPALWKFFMVA